MSTASPLGSLHGVSSPPQGRHLDTTHSSAPSSPTGLNPPSEVLAMLDFLSHRGNGAHLRGQARPILEVTREIPMCLSAETRGWLQQSSNDGDSQKSLESDDSDIPFSEQDDPPDPSDELLPYL